MSQADDLGDAVVSPEAPVPGQLSLFGGPAEVGSASPTRHGSGDLGPGEPMIVVRQLSVSAPPPASRPEPWVVEHVVFEPPADVYVLPAAGRMAFLLGNPRPFRRFLILVGSTWALIVGSLVCAHLLGVHFHVAVSVAATTGASVAAAAVSGIMIAKVRDTRRAPGTGTDQASGCSRPPDGDDG